MSETAKRIRYMVIDRRFEGIAELFDEVFARLEALEKKVSAKK